MKSNILDELKSHHHKLLEEAEARFNESLKVIEERDASSKKDLQDKYNEQLSHIEQEYKQRLDHCRDDEELSVHARHQERVKNAIKENEDYKMMVKSQFSVTQEKYKQHYAELNSLLQQHQSQQKQK